MGGRLLARVPVVAKRTSLLLAQTLVTLIVAIAVPQVAGKESTEMVGGMGDARFSMSSARQLQSECVEEVDKVPDDGRVDPRKPHAQGKPARPINEVSVSRL